MAITILPDVVLKRNSHYYLLVSGNRYLPKVTIEKTLSNNTTCNGFVAREVLPGEHTTFGI